MDGGSHADAFGECDGAGGCGPLEVADSAFGLLVVVVIADDEGGGVVVAVFVDGGVGCALADGVAEGAADSGGGFEVFEGAVVEVED